MGFRIGFLTLTLFVLGWGLGGQLSVVQVVAFVQSLLTGFHWETFLMEPVIFVLWSGVALGLLFWGRGVYCGWLCPFGALQELTNLIARRFGVKQVEVPHAIHERLWIIKYTLFILILGLSFYSMVDALLLAEAEPFKTAITMRMLRAWPFVLFVLALLVAGLFIERFYCRYICPLGAALAIPAKLKIFDWLDRRPQCGRECRLCEQKCTVGAIDPLGRINPNECVLCLRCQVIFNDEKDLPHADAARPCPQGAGRDGRETGCKRGDPMIETVQRILSQGFRVFFSLPPGCSAPSPASSGGFGWGSTPPAACGMICLLPWRRICGTGTR
ncbi:4Fe-4S binding protein [Jhaorihella thermophila]